MRGPKPKNRLGEKRSMKNGLEATIIRYKSSAEIDIQFEDGEIVKNKTYASFVQGKIGHPEILHSCKIKYRTGETRMMSNGMYATVIRYRKATDIDIQFEDNVIRKNCSYKEFKAGHIAHPNYTFQAMANVRVGEKKVMNCGLEATITKYNNYHDVEIIFEDNVVVYPVDYGRFLCGSISHTEYDASMSVQEAGIAFYLEKLGFTKMQRGSLRHLGLGQKELDLYNRENAIAVEVDGHFHNKSGALERDIDKNIKCHNAGITLYRLRDKELPILNDGYSVNYIIEGETLYNGLVDCGNALKDMINEMNIQLPADDFIDFKRDLELILKFYSEHTSSYNVNEKIGEKVWHKATDQYITITDYKDYNHVTVRFDDGEIVRNRNYGAFKKGTIKHPSHTSDAKRSARIGEVRRMSCGYNAKIIEYRNSEDIDVQFEDGTIHGKVTYYNFTKGNVGKGK